MEYLTKEKFEELKKELNELKTVKRKEVAENLEYAKSLGDLSENAEYHEARDMQAAVEDRIGQLENLLQTAQIVTLHHSDVVGVGTTVTIQKDGQKENATYKIVGSEEADMSQKKLSVTSPLGEGLMGKKKGDVVQVTTPKGKTKYSIVAIK
jgi:transcription elongation factor GreA